METSPGAEEILGWLRSREDDPAGGIDGHDRGRAAVHKDLQVALRFPCRKFDLCFHLFHMFSAIWRLRMISETKRPVPTNPAEAIRSRVMASLDGSSLNSSCRTAQTSATTVICQRGRKPATKQNGKQIQKPNGNVRLCVPIDDRNHNNQDAPQRPKMACDSCCE